MRLVMMGTGTFAEPTFEALLAAFGPDVVGLVTQPERDSGNIRGSTRQTGKGMRAIAAAQGVAVAQPESINTPEGLEQLRQMRPDLLAVAAYGQILSKDVLAIPTRGVINVHASLLPKYRGAAPVAYAILGGETQTGVTIIKVTPGLDSGDTILHGALDIHPDDTTGTLEARLAALGAKLAVEVVHMYAAGGPVAGTKQDSARVTKAPKIKKEFGLIDWSRPADYLERFVRAMQPWPTAYTFLHRPGKPPMRIIVSRLRPSSVEPGVEPFFTRKFEVWPAPGTAFASGPGERPLVWVAAADRTVALVELQPAGKKKMAADEFLRGHAIEAGMHFGPEVTT